MARELSDSVVVITGASSGIGRATALKFAEQGANVVLAARREQALQEVEEQCRQSGAQALVVPTDVTQEASVQNLARRAIERFGRIDTWVNNAGVSMFGRFEESPMEDYEQVIRTNLFGYIYGARAAIPYFREQGAGVLINNGSVVSLLAQPYTSAYSVSKFGIRGLTEGLRMELRDAPRIHACTLLPASIDTPIFQHAANFTGRGVKPMDPVYPAELVADAIISLAKRPRREVIVGRAGGAVAAARAIAPARAEALMAQRVETDHLTRTATEASHGNLFEPLSDGVAVSGGWTAQVRRARTRKRTMSALAAVAAVALPAGLYLLWRRQQRRPTLMERLPGRRRRLTARAPRLRRGAGLPILGALALRRPAMSLGERLMQRLRAVFGRRGVAGLDMPRLGGARGMFGRRKALPQIQGQLKAGRRSLEKASRQFDLDRLSAQGPLKTAARRSRAALPQRWR